MSGKVGSRSKSLKPPPPPPPPRIPKGRRRGPPRRLARPADPNVPEAFERKTIKTLVIITCHSNACECVTGQCFRPRFKTPYDLLFTSNYGCPTITYGSFFDVARNLFEKIRSSIVRRGDPVNGDVMTRAIYSTVSVRNLGKDPAGDWLGLPGTLGRSTNLKFHEKGKKVSNLTMFGPGTSEAQDVNGVYVFQLDKDRIPQLGNDDSIRDYNILNKLEILRQLGIQKNPDTSTEVRPGLFHYPDSTYSRTDQGDITLKYLLDGVKKLTIDVRGRSTLMVPPDEALVIPLTCRILEGAPREGEPLVSPTSSQFSRTSSTPLGVQVEDKDKGKDDFDDLFGPGGGGGGGGGKTRRHKLTKKYRLRSRSRTRSKPKSTKKRGIK
jgi:hypothetical protein